MGLWVITKTPLDNGIFALGVNVCMSEAGLDIDSSQEGDLARDCALLHIPYSSVCT